MEINWRNIAQMAYERYADTHNHAIEFWSELSANEQAAWIAAVQTACEVYGRAVTA